jgi:methylated-DNA-protein-cysteine methyltransferase-like protein
LVSIVRMSTRSRINLREFLGGRGASAGGEAALQAIWEVVAMIPSGRVSTYGEVARLAGLPGRARQAGYALKHVPADMHLPWHRVLGAGGRIVFPKSSRPFREQSRRLRAEGVVVNKGRVDAAALWEP